MTVLAVGLPFLNEIVALFITCVLIAYLCFRLRLVPIAGFLLAGVIIGPSALGLVTDQELINILAEIGVILLLFTLGIEFSLEKLAKLRKAIFVGGGIQVLATVGIVGGIVFALGSDWNAAIYTGCLVALSSTAIVIGLLADRDETDTPAGRLALAVLIFQDLAIVLMVLLVPILGGQGGDAQAILWVLAKAAALIGAVLVLARRVVPWILEHIAHTRRQELFLLGVVAICFGTAALSSVAGVSLALGAFLAGLVVSESHYADHALSEILPFRTVFNAVFFASVGMLLDLSFLMDRPLLVLGAAGAALLLKTLLTTGSILALGQTPRIALTVGVGLAQIGEFSFVLERAGRTVGLTPAGLGEAGVQTFIAATVLLMLLTPFQMQVAPRLGAMLGRLRFGGSRTEGKSDGGPDESGSARSAEGEEVHLEDHVVVVGYGHAGRRLAAVLKDRRIPFIIVDMNPESIDEVRKAGLRAVFGDASRSHILEAAEVETAKLCVIVTNEPAISSAIIRQARYLNPTLQIIARSRYMHDMERLQRMGADIVVPEEMETTVRIFSHVLGAYMIPPEEVDRQVRLLRSDDYGVMRGSIQEAHLMVLQGLDEDGMHTRAVAVRAGAPAAGRTLIELALRRDHGVTVLAVRRAGRTFTNPSSDFEVHAGDRLILVGSAEHFVGTAHLFRTPDAT